MIGAQGGGLSYPFTVLHSTENRYNVENVLNFGLQGSQDFTALVPVIKPIVEINLTG